MRRIKNYSIKKESISEMIRAGNFNPSLKITFQDKLGQYTHKLASGTEDTLDVYRESTETYVLFTNPSLGYVGLEVFERTQKTGEIFLEEYQIKKVFEGKNLVPFNAIKRLRDYIT